MIGLDSPVEAVLGNAGAGGKKAAARRKALTRLGIETVGDLIEHFPRRYLPMGELTRIADLTEGDQITVVGRVVESAVRAYSDRRTGRQAYRVETVVATDGPQLTMTFFAPNKHVAGWRASQLAPGREGVFVGKVGRFRNIWQLANPQVIPFHSDAGEVSEKDQAALAAVNRLRGLFPLYPASAGIESWDLQQVIGFALDVVDPLPDVLPEEVRARHRLLDRATACALLHTPADYAEVNSGRRRYRFAEALTTQLVLARRRAAVRRAGARPRAGGGDLLAAFDARLPFELTTGQRQVGEEIFTDLAQPHPMNRLLQGEVGSGKTLVALRAMLRVVDSGGQAALLAPTEVLAVQHHRSITAMLGDLAAGGMLTGAAEATCVELLTGSMTKAQRTGPLSRLASGEAGIVIGTHALLTDQVSFADLGLVVVDEQHRFGVEQRAALTDKAGTPPHLLVMTATPIPRTVAMTVFGDLETSTLRELPAGRADVQTTVVPLAEQPGWLPRVWQRVTEEAARGHQVFVVCPRIGGEVAEAGQVDQVDVDDEGEEVPVTRPLAAVEELTAHLAEGPLSQLRVAMLHGRLPTEEKDQVMRDFAAGAIDVLVATTVIEVGVDVPNATTMVLLDADRFGVSQLHQLRGRVGRGGLPGLCLLVTHADPDSPARERLDAVAATRDGFELARVDLEQRREGDVLGASQSGFRSSLQNLRVLRDEQTILAAREEADLLLAEDAELARWPGLAAEVAALEESAASEFLERS
ncbi:ATP-dependent DNA helicase RecG [Nocardioides limicola]|uniref:ATP-dependent DNA helicase RecG n=1 Tax=Nocardioides limicola TaxID=2803368 RepID=UPI00193C6F77|nr:ATP-dependent DNA helicase RecG [Nocardioides sp. DJM-14]